MAWHHVDSPEDRKVAARWAERAQYRPSGIDLDRLTERLERIEEKLDRILAMPTGELPTPDVIRGMSAEAR